MKIEANKKLITTQVTGVNITRRNGMGYGL